jgi:hypothetical protein
MDKATSTSVGPHRSHALILVTRLTSKAPAFKNRRLGHPKFQVKGRATRPVSMVGGTIHREVIHGEISRVLVLHPALATTRCASAERAELRLDNAFVLIEGHPAVRIGG